MARYAVVLPRLFATFLDGHPQLRSPFIEAGLFDTVEFAAFSAGVCAAAGFVAGVLALLPRRWTLRLLRGGYMAAWVLFAIYAQAVIRATQVILARNISIDGVKPTPATIFFCRYDLLWPAALAGLLLLGLYLCSWRRAVINLYTGANDERPAQGDVILNYLLLRGRDPAYCKSMWASLVIHVLVLVVLPWLCSLQGCVQPYRVPKGSGSPQVAAPQKIIIKAQKAKKKKKRFLLNPRSAISFHVPELDESDVDKKVDTESQLTYSADVTRLTGAGDKLGAGRGSGGKLGAGGGQGGGWPDGVQNAKVRFVRLEYGGPGWDDGMDAVSRADMNFLDMFRKLTGFNVAAQSESHPIGSLAKYPKGMAPPFVYMTGSGDIRVSDRDVAVLRDYVMNGGMLFADCGSPRWDASFRSLAQRVLPGAPLITIADDDAIFRAPFLFAHGAPPLWHHGGMRAQGARYKGRWAIFYHPGDINDAWKTGHSGMDANMSEGAFEMGVNVVFYAFTHYLELTRKERQ